MSIWAIKRQLFYISIIVGILVIFFLIFILPKLIKEPTCFDNKKNNEETGIDCGGSCQKICLNDISNLSILWSRSFNISKNIYNSLAYVENINSNSVVPKISYEFKLYDENDVLITKRTGNTFIGSGGKMAILEANINVGNRTPKKTTFQFMEQATWKQLDKEAISSLSVLIKDKIIENETDRPKLSASIINNSIYDISDIEVIAIIYNDKLNAIAVSKTMVEILKGSSSQKIYFTWPEPFEESVFKIEILSKINPLINNF
ncbi:hypothetical protein A2995_00930 [Candidatus Nomurabacteria bacterium RIFCSPLOWO2_01_FULL_33_24]|uniref:Uncharacterized protein n=1 Tax=Candidatus Nomurabacteria bacterium RIFCSPLOWO2_01_FULL_33_24 TaxID=1801765 RepID=A0A1F6X2P6_9BACT|nr:MAG: hypothetical protein A2995_00930 [Candidatus Nomurabacteria bacterium RIFCSPLOWO2_01_FULL_33_24]